MPDYYHRRLSDNRLIAQTISNTVPDGADYDLVLKSDIEAAYTGPITQGGECAADFDPEGKGLR